MKVPWPHGRAEAVLQRAVLLVLSVALAGLVGLAIVAFVSSQEAADQALRTRDRTAAAATRRIDLLQDRIDELVGRGEANAELLGQLVAEVEALRAQVRSLGGDPIVAGGTRWSGRWWTR